MQFKSSCICIMPSFGKRHLGTLIALTMQSLMMASMVPTLQQLQPASWVNLIGDRLFESLHCSDLAKLTVIMRCLVTMAHFLALTSMLCDACMDALCCSRKHAQSAE